MSDPDISPTPGPYYRRSLPNTCVDFGSSEGKELFLEGLLNGTMNVYFKLAAQFQTQEEPAFCGLTTLVMTLNALEVDPGRVWKAPWKWYHESMLDCCKPLDDVKKTGVNFEQFACLARCNRLIVDKTYVDKDDERFLRKFRATVLSSVRSDTHILAVSYDRQILGQTGVGHFSTVGGYHAKSDRVLILDVARFKYPPHWVSLELLWKAMQSVDVETNKPRGYVLMSVEPNSTPLMLLQLLPNYSGLKALDDLTRKWLMNQEDHQNGDIKEQISEMTNGGLSTLLKKWLDCSQRYQLIDFRNGLTFDGAFPDHGSFVMNIGGFSTCHCKKVDPDYLNVINREIVPNLLSLLGFSSFVSIGCQLMPALLLTSLFYAWPFERYQGSTTAEKIASVCRYDLSQLPSVVSNELSQLKSQLNVVLSYLSSEKGALWYLESKD